MDGIKVAQGQTREQGFLRIDLSRKFLLVELVKPPATNMPVNRGNAPATRNCIPYHLYQ